MEPYEPLGVFGGIWSAEGHMTEQDGPEGQRLTALPAKERAERYRQFATEAMLKAQAAPDHEQRAKFLTMASGWHKMASEAERSLDSEAHIQTTFSARQTVTK
jgi:hypothetical protein